MKSILITGADGFLGSHLTDFLISKDYEIYALIKPKGSVQNLIQYTNRISIFSDDEKLKFLEKKILIPTINKKLKILECDIRNKSLLEEIIQNIKPNLIFHFAAQSLVIPSWEDPVYTIETNIIGTINVFEPIKKQKINTRVIVACSSAEYGTSTELNRPLKEEDPLLAIHPYGISKIATELLARQYYLNFGIDTINLRFFIQTGPRKVNDACSDFIKQVVQIELGLKEPIIQVGNLDTSRDITGIADSLQAIWLAAIKGRSGETYNVCTNKKIQIRDILNIALGFSLKKIKVLENDPKKLRKTDENSIIGDNAKIKKELYWNITQSIEDILKDIYDYWITFYKNQNLSKQ